MARSSNHHLISGTSFCFQNNSLQALLFYREDHPVTTQDSSNAAVKNGRRRSKNGGSNFSGTHKVLRDHREKNNSWMGPSEASSPSLGPKSLTDSESREESHTGECSTVYGNNLIVSFSAMEYFYFRAIRSFFWWY